MAEYFTEEQIAELRGKEFSHTSGQLEKLRPAARAGNVFWSLPPVLILAGDPLYVV